MQKLMALARGTSDYVHTDEEVQIIDAATGETYGLFLKSGATAPTESASVFLHIPSRVVAAVGGHDDYLIVELRLPRNEEEAAVRQQKLRTRLPVE